MRRKVFDKLASIGGALIVVVLVVAGALLMWGSNFASSTVHNQLASQQIYFPPASAFAHPKAGTEITPAMIPIVSQYAGQQVLTGEQAKVYADNFIAAHLAEMPYGGVYAKVSSAARANPNDTALAAEVQTSFQGTSLRAMLLEAYGFATFGEIAFIASIASFILAALMLLLVVAGLWHARQVSEETELLSTGKLSAVAA